MRSRTLSAALFIVVALVQIYVPAKMIFVREVILSEGKEYKFKTAPIDPNDPFRGKYITLRFDEATVKIANEADWMVGETVFAVLATNDQGFAQIQSVTHEKPSDEKNFLKTRVRHVTTNSTHQLTLDYPFDRFYLEESKAVDAELAYRESVLDTGQVAYALVVVKNGEAVLKDVLINGVPLKEVVTDNGSDSTP